MGVLGGGLFPSRGVGGVRVYLNRLRPAGAVLEMLCEGFFGLGWRIEVSDKSDCLADFSVLTEVR